MNPLAFHENQHDILDGLEDMDDIFGISHEKDGRQHQEKEPDNKKIKEPKEKKKDQKKTLQ